MKVKELFNNCRVTELILLICHFLESKPPILASPRICSHKYFFRILLMTFSENRRILDTPIPTVVFSNIFLNQEATSVYNTNISKQVLSSISKPSFVYKIEIYDLDHLYLMHAKFEFYTECLEHRYHVY